MLALFILLFAVNSAPAVDDNQVFLSFIFFDSEGNEGAYTSSIFMTGIHLELEFDNGAKRVGDDAIDSDILFDTMYPERTPLIFHLSMPFLDGPVMGYNFVGFGSPGQYMVPLPASQVPDLRHQVYDPPDPWYGVSSYFLVADNLIHPSLVLREDFSAQWFDQRPIHASVQYLSGSSFFPRTQYADFASGDVYGDFITLIWGAFPQPINYPFQLYMGAEIPTPPAIFSAGADGYTTTTLQITPRSNAQDSYKSLLTPQPGYPNASALIQSISLEVPEPPAWIKERAISEKMQGKVKWLYPPLDRYADVNGDHVIDAADLVALLQTPTP
ncbi:hypothetical protein BH09SUM1_BH09SUM1_30520 [soil metagenome]